MKVLVWDDGFLGDRDDNNIIRELHAVYPDHVTVKMNDGSIWAYHNAISIDLLHCPKCKKKIKEDFIGRENNNVSYDYVGACDDCDEDFYLFEMLNNTREEKEIR